MGIFPYHPRQEKSFKHWSDLKAWYGQGHDPLLGEMLARHPLLPVLANRPYVNTAWNQSRRMDAVQNHYRLVRDETLDVLVFPAEAMRVLALLDDIQPGLRLVLDKPPWFAVEGEVAINLFSGERRLYSLLFTLARARDGSTLAYVGALQGSSGDDALDVYRALTHAADGMRPRDLMFASFRLLCRELGIDHIEAVSDAASARQSNYFERSIRPSFSYDAAWQEYAGVAQADGFYRIGTSLPLRDLQDIPPRKRAQYRRRYSMLDALACRIGHAVGRQPVRPHAAPCAMACDEMVPSPNTLPAHV